MSRKFFVSCPEFRLSNGNRRSCGRVPGFYAEPAELDCGGALRGRALRDLQLRRPSHGHPRRALRNGGRIPPPRRHHRRPRRIPPQRISLAGTKCSVGAVVWVATDNLISTFVKQPAQWHQLPACEFAWPRTVDSVV